MKSKRSNRSNRSSLQFHREKDLFLSSSKNSDCVHKRFDLVEVIT